MKKFVFALMALLVWGFSQPVFAQKSKPKPNSTMNVDDRVKKETAKATEKLALTADQQKLWEQAARKRMERMMVHREKMKGSTTPEERKELARSMRTEMETFDKEIQSFLTAEQKTQWAKVKENGKNKIKDHKGKKQKVKPESDDTDIF